MVHTFSYLFIIALLLKRQENVKFVLVIYLKYGKLMTDENHALDTSIQQKTIFVQLDKWRFP